MMVWGDWWLRILVYSLWMEESSMGAEARPTFYISWNKTSIDGLDLSRQISSTK